MALRASQDVATAIAGLDPELRAGAEAIGQAVAAQLSRLRPAVTADAGEATVVSLAMDRDGEADAVTTAACLAAHGSYVRSRGMPAGVSTGALALARLLVWAQRAAMLGPAPRLAWVGPEARRPPELTGPVLSAECAVQAGDQRRRARAAAVLQPRD
ncbi:MAG: hypothetical protein U0Y82_08765 [Thermoleophilia bacterium]